MEDTYKKLQSNLLRYIQSLLHVSDKSACYLGSFKAHDSEVTVEWELFTHLQHKEHLVPSNPP
jgi:hypothetical protein